MIEIQQQDTGVFQKPIAVLEKRLLQYPHIYPYSYEDLNKASQNDHRVELPFVHTAKIIDILQRAKNVHYDNSYSKRGVFSIFFNMERKWERIVAGIFSGDLAGAASESFLDTCVDLAAYSLKLVAWICVRRPDMYAKLLQQVAAEAEAVSLIPPPVQEVQEVLSLVNPVYSRDECLFAYCPDVEVCKKQNHCQHGRNDVPSAGPTEGYTNQGQKL